MSAVFPRSYSLWPVLVLVLTLSCWLLWHDQYVTICHLLQYLLLMSLKVCVYLLSGTWLYGLENSVKHTVLTLSVDPTRSATFSVTSHCSWSSPAQTPLSVGLCSIWPAPPLAWAPAYLLQWPTCSSSLTSLAFPLPRAGVRPSLTVHPTSLCLVQPT